LGKNKNFSKKRKKKKEKSKLDNAENEIYFFAIIGAPAE
jgi:hypothetical protein